MQKLGGYKAEINEDGNTEVTHRTKAGNFSGVFYTKDFSPELMEKLKKEFTSKQ